MEAVVKVTNYNSHPHPSTPPSPLSAQTSQACSAEQMRRRETREGKVVKGKRGELDGGQKLRGFVVAGAPLALRYLRTPLSPGPSTLPSTPSYYTTSSPAGLAAENEEKRRGGFRAFLLPSFSPQLFSQHKRRLAHSVPPNGGE